MSSPVASGRHLVHTRKVNYMGYRRDDGLWDIEGELVDAKAQPFSVQRLDRVWQPGEPIHHMFIRATLDNHYVVQDIVVEMREFPQGLCPKAMASMRGVIGHSMGRGWRKTIEAHMGKELGCTHLRELLYNMATAAFQTMNGQGITPKTDGPPPYLGQCAGWDLAGSVVKEFYPQFYRAPVHTDPPGSTE